jgi:hypothetical protein
MPDYFIRDAIGRQVWKEARRQLIGRVEALTISFTKELTSDISQNSTTRI